MSVSGEQLLKLVGECTGLGHKARNESFLRQLRLLLESPGASLPQAAGKRSKEISGKGSFAMTDLTSLYRFAKNEQATLDELRWKVEESFRLLKTGYKKIESQRFFDANRTAKLLLLLSLASMTLFHLKAELGLPSGGYLNEDNYQKLKQATREINNPEFDVKWRLLAYIAQSGGWLGRRNDPIGPTILMRGWLEVSATLDAVVGQAPLIQQVLETPDLLRSLICV